MKRWFTNDKKEIENFKNEIKSKGTVWNKQWDIHLLKLSKKYGTHNYKAIAKEMNLDRLAVKNWLWKLLKLIKT